MSSQALVLVWLVSGAGQSMSQAIPLTRTGFWILKHQVVKLFANWNHGPKDGTHFKLNFFKWIDIVDHPDHVRTVSGSQLAKRVHLQHKLPDYQNKFRRPSTQLQNEYPTRHIVVAICPVWLTTLFTLQFLQQGFPCRSWIFLTSSEWKNNTKLQSHIYNGVMPNISRSMDDLLAS